MNCSNCGSQIRSEQQFCRSCGADLHGNQPQRLDRRVLPGLSMSFGGIVIALLGRMLFHLDIVTLVGVLISIAGMFYIAAYPYLQRSLKPKPKAGPNRQREAMLSAGATNRLPPMDLTDAVPSVTEHTTNLLKVPITERRKR